ncbi:MAG: aldo/keto reductase [Defluviitaleaceae bacterium]|nr:aldo/keto reductase [Defluviitaleaceae bacterium]
MKFKNTNGNKLSLLGMGAMRLPQIAEGWGQPVDYPRAEEILDLCIAGGINYFDTAYPYHGGDSERFLGKALGRYARDSFFVADKYNLIRQPDYRVQFAEQLERLQMDYIDYYLCHGISDQYIEGYLGNGCVEYFLEKKREGRIRNWGFSFHGSPEVLRKALAHCEWDFVMLQMNYYDWHHSNMKELYSIVEKAGVPLFVMEPVHGGMLANLTEEGNALLRAAEPNMSIASWALRFVMDLPHVSVILSGMSDIAQVKDNIATVSESKPLSPADKELLLQASTMLFNTIGAPCTFCKYCECPKGIDIPTALNYYNDYKAGGEWRLNRLLAQPPEKRPAACVNCGICVKACPQELDIPKYMQDMAGVMGNTP